MSFDEWMDMSERLWGPDAMQVFCQYALGQIDLETCISGMKQAYLDYSAG